jgi:hypothetical protein
VASYLTAYPALDLTLGSCSAFGLSTLFVVGAPPPELFLERRETPDPALDAAGGRDESFASRLLAALAAVQGRLDATAKAERPAAERELPLERLQAWPALVLGQPPQASGSLAAIRLFDLHWSTLAPLHHYQQLRTLTYDNF